MKRVQCLNCGTQQDVPEGAQVIVCAKKGGCPSQAFADVAIAPTADARAPVAKAAQ